MRTASWIIVRKADRQAIAETFKSYVAEAINKDKYEAVPVAEWLSNVGKVS